MQIFDWKEILRLSAQNKLYAVFTLEVFTLWIFQEKTQMRSFLTYERVVDVIKNSQLKGHPQFLQFLDILTKLFLFLTKLFAGKPPNCFWSTKFAYKCKISPKMSHQNTMQLYRQN